MVDYLYDTLQIKSFRTKFFEGNNYFYSYQLSAKLIFKSIYIPFGPICNTKDGFDNFINDLNKLHFTKIKIDLPIILDSDIKNYVVDKLLKNGFKKSTSIQDEETILILKEKFGLKSKFLKKVENTSKVYSTEITSIPNIEDFEQIYSIYVNTAKVKNFVPKSKQTFKDIQKNGLYAILHNKESGKVEGFILGHFMTILNDYFKNLPKEIIKFNNIFSSLSNEARNLRAGYQVHYDLYNAVYEKGTHVIDFHGASRTKSREYTIFKEKFGGEFVSYPGSFEKILK